MNRLFGWLAATLLVLPAPAMALTISGASTIQPMIAELAERYEQQTGVAIDLSGGGSGRGISDTLDGSSDIGMVSRTLRDDERAAVEYATIGLDTLVFIVNQANPLRDINRRQLNRLYTDARDWSGLVDGFDWPLRPVSKEVGRSTLDLFEDYSGLISPDRSGSSRQPIRDDTTVIGANIEALTLVGGQRGAVGYVSLGAAGALREQGMAIRILDLSGVTPSARTIQSGDYPIRRELNLVYQELTPEIEALLEIFASAEGRRVIEGAGFIAVEGR